MDRRPEGNAIDQSGLFRFGRPCSATQAESQCPFVFGADYSLPLNGRSLPEGRQSAESLLRRGHRSPLVYVQNTLFSASGQE